MTGERTPEGYFRLRNGLELAIDRALAYAPYADLLWCETQEPSLKEARQFSEAIHARFPGKHLTYNLSPSFNWDKFVSPGEQRIFQSELGRLGYKFQFVTLAGFHTLNHSMFDLAKGFAAEGMPAYVKVQRHEFESEKNGYTATRHQSFVGASYFDEVLRVVSGGATTTAAMENSIEDGQFAPVMEEPGRREGPRKKAVNSENAAT
jgi:isocitrate lyase